MISAEVSTPPLDPPMQSISTASQDLLDLVPELLRRSSPTSMGSPTRSGNRLEVLGPNQSHSMEQILGGFSKTDDATCEESKARQLSEQSLEVVSALQGNKASSSSESDSDNSSLPDVISLARSVRTTIDALSAKQGLKFQNFDPNRWSRISYEDFNDIMVTGNSGLKPDQVRLVATALDKYSTGLIDYNNIMDALVEIEQESLSSKDASIVKDSKDDGSSGNNYYFERSDNNDSNSSSGRNNSTSTTNFSSSIGDIHSDTHSIVSSNRSPSNKANNGGYLPKFESSKEEALRRLNNSNRRNHSKSPQSLTDFLSPTKDNNDSNSNDNAIITKSDYIRSPPRSPAGKLSNRKVNNSYTNLHAKNFAISDESKPHINNNNSFDSSNVKDSLGQTLIDSAGEQHNCAKNLFKSQFVIGNSNDNNDNNNNNKNDNNSNNNNKNNNSNNVKDLLVQELPVEKSREVHHSERMYRHKDKDSYFVVPAKKMYHNNNINDDQVYDAFEESSSSSIDGRNSNNRSKSVPRSMRYSDAGSAVGSSDNYSMWQLETNFNKGLINLSDILSPTPKPSASSPSRMENDVGNSIAFQINGKVNGLRHGLRRIDQSRSGIVSFDEFSTVLTQHGVNIPHESLKKYFVEVAAGNSKRETYEKPSLEVDSSSDNIISQNIKSLNIEDFIKQLRSRYHNSHTGKYDDNKRENFMADDVKHQEKQRVAKNILHRLNKLSDPFLAFKDLDKDFSKFGTITKDVLKNGLRKSGVVMSDHDFVLIEDKISLNQEGRLNLKDFDAALCKFVNDYDRSEKNDSLSSYKENERYSKSFQSSNGFLECYSGNQSEFAAGAKMSLSNRVENLQWQRLQRLLQSQPRHIISNVFSTPAGYYNNNNYRNSSINSSNSSSQSGRKEKISFDELSNRLDKIGLGLGSSDRVCLEKHIKQSKIQSNNNNTFNNNSDSSDLIDFKEFCTLINIPTIEGKYEASQPRYLASFSLPVETREPNEVNIMHFSSTNKKFEGSRKKKIPQPLFEFFTTTTNSIGGNTRDPLMPHPYLSYRGTINSLRDQLYNSTSRIISSNPSICQNALHPSSRDLRHSSNSYPNRTTVKSLINMSSSTFERDGGSSGGTSNKVDNNYYSLNNYNVDKLNSVSHVSSSKGLSSSLSSFLPSAAAAAIYQRARSAPPRANNRATNSYQNSYQNQVYRLNLQPNCITTSTSSSSGGGGSPSPADAEAARRSNRTLLKYQLHVDQHQHHSSSASNPPFALFHS